ncbi:MAG TPA: DinB family protein [Terriglobales bacterium]|nr:DinB family protein [Terriglobales bacterium]
MKIGIVLLLVAGVTVCAAQDKPNSGTAAKGRQRSFVGGVPTTIADSVAETLKFVEGSFLGVAEAMPEDKYGYIPTAGKFDDVRSFGEQVKHVACAQFAMFNEFEGKKPPDDCERGGHDPAKSKAELIKYLKDSFNYSNRVIATLTAQNAVDRIEGRYAGPNTKLGISVVSVWHMTDHYGQLVEYLRMNDIVPPMTQKYGLKVR